VTFRQSLWVSDGKTADFNGAIIPAGAEFGEFRGGTMGPSAPFAGNAVPGALDTTRKRIVTSMSGGHGGWCDWGVNELDWATGTWNPDGRPMDPLTRIIRIAPPSYEPGEHLGPQPCDSIVLFDPHHYYDTAATVDTELGKRVFPVPNHSGGTFKYMPSVRRFLYWGGFGGDWSGNTGMPWPMEWDPETRQWSSDHADSVNIKGGSQVSGLAWDSTRNWMLHYRDGDGEGGVYRYDPAAEPGKRVAPLWISGRPTNDQGSLLCDSRRQRAVYLTRDSSGVTGSFYLDLSANPNSPRMTRFELTGDILTGTNQTLDTAHPAWECDPIGDRYLLWCGGKTVYWINPDTFVAAAYTPSGGIDPGTRNWGTPNGGYLLEYLPADDVFIGLNHLDTQGFEVFAPKRE
jgi:hypothetical protein